LVAPTAAELGVESIFEADWEGAAYGDRPRRSGIDRIKEVHGSLCRGYTDMVDAGWSKYLHRCFIPL
jgi:RNA-directed DNA polymerase